MPFTLNERVLAGLLAVNDRELQRLRAAMEAIELEPLQASHSAVLDHKGRLVYAASIEPFWLYYWLDGRGSVHFIELLAD